MCATAVVHGSTFYDVVAAVYTCFFLIFLRSTMMYTVIWGGEERGLFSTLSPFAFVTW